MKPRRWSSGKRDGAVVRDNVTEQEQTKRSGLAAVGARLEQAREQQQRSMESVASDLHLRLEVVQAIEAGDAEQLPAATFLRGYIKSYARLLELDEAGLVAQLPAATERSPEPLKRVGMRRRASVSLPLGKWLLWILVITALVLLVVYGMPVVERLWTSQGSDSAPAGQLPLPQEHLQLPLEPTGENHEADAPPLVAAPEPEVQEPPATPGPEPAEVTQPQVEPVVEEQPAAPEPVKQAAGPALIQLRFSEDSWVEMEAHGRKLVVGTQYAGSERTVRAEPPIQILLGNAPGVELVYRGKVVDITPYQRGKVARLVLED
ncbi:MAG TPA: DUF4115 domain-containing protein [Gammaproteobacteria bacterium]|nr:DUF4115 domain-containing protein [Gammaproteobacteria bacterium]